MRKRFGIPFGVFCILALLALALLVVPMLKAAQFDVPSLDDYANGGPTYKAWVRTGSISAVLKVAWNRVYRLYFEWQGTFSAIFLFTLNPMIFGEQYYGIGACVIIAMLLIGIFDLTFAVWSRLFRAEKTESAIIAVVWAVICTQFLPRASQGFYWYTGAVYYTFFFGLAAVAYAVLLRYITRGDEDHGNGKLIAASLLLFFIGGGNLVTGLTTAVLLVSMELLLILLRKKDWKPLLIPTLFFMIAFGLNVAAPGNAVRQKHFGQPGLFRAVFLSFEESWNSLGKWITLPVIALILMLIPVMWRIISRTRRAFPMPVLVSLYSFCLTGVMYYPPIYAEGVNALKSLARITDIIFYGTVFLVIFNVFYWMGWLTQRGILSERLFPHAENGSYRLIYLLLMLLVFGFGMTRIKWYDVTDISIYRSYRSGEMSAYWNTYRKNLEILKDPEVEDAVLKRFPYRPYVLYYKETSGKTLAGWYGKNSAVVQ